MPRLSRFRHPACLSNSRSTTRSPCPVGSVETRTSTGRPAILSVIRPSCGKRFSAISSCAMTLMRDTMAACKERRGSRMSRKMPSTRKRTNARCSKIWKWISEAPSRKAWVSSALMRRIIGASSSDSKRSVISGSACANCCKSTSLPRSSIRRIALLSWRV